MPKVVNKKTGQATDVTDETAARLVGSGQFDLAGGERIEVRSTTGGRVRVGARGMRADRTLGVVGSGQQADEARHRRQVHQYAEGALNKIKALGEGFVSGASFGLADPLLEDEATAARRELLPGYRGVGEFGGMILPSVLTGGESLLARGLSATPAGLVARGGSAVSQRLGGGLIGTIGSGAFEGALGNAGYYLSDVALGDRDLSAEGFVASMGQGALWGGAGGAVGHGVERGFVTARSMFPRVAGGLSGKKSIQAAEAALEADAGKMLSAGDDLVKAGRERLRALRAEKAEAGLDLARAQEAGNKEGVQAARGRLRSIRTQEAEARYQIANKRPAPPAATVGDVAPPRGPIPAFDDVVDGATVRLSPDDLLGLDVRSLPTGFEEGRVAAIAKARAAGKDVGRPKVVVHGDGSIEVTNGRHRLVEAARAKRPIDVEISQGVRDATAARGATTSIWEQSGMRSPMEQAIEGIAPVVDDKTAREVERLASLIEDVDIKKSAARDYIASLRKKAGPGAYTAPVDDGVTHGFRKRTTAFRDAEGNAVTGIKAMEQMPDEVIARNMPLGHGGDVMSDYDDLIRQAAQSSDDGVRETLIRQAADLEMQAFDAAPPWAQEQNRLVLERRGKLGMDAMDIARSRVQRRVDDIAKVRPEDAEYLVTGKRPPRKDVGGGMSREDGYRKMAREIDERYADTSVQESMQRSRDMIARKHGRLVEIDPNDPYASFELDGAGGLVADTERAAKVIGDYERAQAELAEALGPDAPPAAKEIADQYRGALDDAERKTQSRVAQAADDAAEEAAGSAPHADPVPESTSGRGAFSKAADIGTALEVLQTMGLPGIPDLSHLPVIGPMLRLYLKVRAARSLLGKMGGKVPATAEAKAAAKAAQARDRVAASVDRMLGLGERAAKRAKPAAARTAVLTHRLFDDGVRRDEAKTHADAAVHRIDELAAAVSNPAAIRKAARRALHGAQDPDLVAAVEAALARKLNYLHQHAPKQPPPSLLGRKKWTPSPVELERFARRVEAAEDPVGVLEQIEFGAVTKEAAETLRAVYPQLYQEAQIRLIERSGEIESTLPYQRVLSLSILFDVPLVNSMRPERVADLQASAMAPAPGMQPPAPMTTQPPPGGAPSLSSLYTPPGDRRARS